MRALTRYLTPRGWAALAAAALAVFVLVQLRGHS